MKQEPPKRKIILYPAKEQGDLEQFARALVAVARRLAQEQDVVQSTDPQPRKKAA